MGDPLISFPVKGHTEPLTFFSVEQLDQWVTQEQNFWAWLQPLASNDGNISTLWADMSHIFGKVRSQISSYGSNTDTAHRKNVMNALKQYLSDLYNTPKALPSSSPGAQFVTSLKAHPHVAAYALYGLINKNPSQQAGNAWAIKGIALAMMFEHGISVEATEAHQSALVVAQDQWNAFREKSSLEYAEDKKSTEKLKADVEAWHTQQQAMHHQLVEATQKNFEEVANKGKENFETIQRTYNEQLGLQAPVQYWEDRAKSYLWTSIWFSSAAIILAVSAALAVWGEIQWLVIPYSESPPPSDGSQGFHFTIHAWRYAFVIASAAFLVWPIRILVRILLSAVHLRTDALERATLAKTYLSLLSRNEGLDQHDRRLILEVLFRPSNTGIVADDAAPASIIHLLSRLGAGDKAR